METRNRVMKATLGFFALPTEPSNIVESLITNLIILLGAILLTRWPKQSRAAVAYS